MSQSHLGSRAVVCLGAVYFFRPTAFICGDMPDCIENSSCGFMGSAVQDAEFYSIPVFGCLRDSGNWIKGASDFVETISSLGPDDASHVSAIITVKNSIHMCGVAELEGHLDSKGVQDAMTIGSACGISTRKHRVTHRSITSSSGSVTFSRKQSGSFSL